MKATQNVSLESALTGSAAAVSGAMDCASGAKETAGSVFPSLHSRTPITIVATTFALGKVVVPSAQAAETAATILYVTPIPSVLVDDASRTGNALHERPLRFTVGHVEPSAFRL